VGSFLVMIAVILIVNINVSMTSIEKYFIKSEQIEIFKLDFNRIMSTFRDVASGLYASFSTLNLNFYDDIIESYQRILVTKRGHIFNSERKPMTFWTNTYVGTLDELVDVLLFHVIEVLQTKNFDMIEELHNSVILDISSRIQDQKIYMHDLVVSHISSISELKNITTFLIIFGVVCYYILMIMFFRMKNTNCKKRMAKIMLTSDR
jgi:hypothetical protein